MADPIPKELNQLNYALTKCVLNHGGLPVVPGQAIENPGQSPPQYIDATLGARFCALTDVDIQTTRANVRLHNLGASSTATLGGTTDLTSLLSLFYTFGAVNITSETGTVGIEENTYER